MFGLTDINSYDNKNPAISGIYLSCSSDDAKYEVAESALRSAIYIPKDFKYGADGKTVVILVPGTGTYGGEGYSHNFAKLIKASSWGDAVWLNIKGRMNDNSNRNAEHVAYAMNYMHAACKGRPMAIVAWSQGNLVTQWALKYWPSTRKTVNNFICLCADFHGTIGASIMAPFSIGLVNPSIWTQKRNSHFVQALRDNGGDSAYVPSTSIYSATDSIVTPQTGDAASAWLKSHNGVEAKNYELQRIAPMTPAGFIYTHATVLVNPITWALAQDAIVNGGPADSSRIDVNGLCMNWVANGLNALDATITEGVLGICGASITAYPWKVMSEPALPDYALKQMKGPLMKVDTTEAPVAESEGQPIAVG